ncbi:hypothetical protein PUN28_014961 [Cardiocondyla obscurior]|uniref:Uncharacterized protein n=1 Tax=Cardiocondyla obscurior TaxID=286306 RepID=A0AAW2F1L9_9HYME
MSFCNEFIFRKTKILPLRLSRRGYSGFLISVGFRRGSIELTINYWRRFRGLPAAVVKHYAARARRSEAESPGSRPYEVPR